MSGSVQVVYHSPRDIRVEEAPDEMRPAPGEVVVEVLACAICGSDLKTWESGNPRILAPRTIGHEFCGAITAIGDGVSAHWVGQRVTMATTMGCGACPLCLRGMANLCEDLQAIGFHCDGAMATRVRIPARGVSSGNLVDVGNMDPVFAALSEPTSCVVNCLSRLDGRAARSLLVIGLGPLGILHGLLARDLGIPVVVGVGRPGPRLERATAFGFDELVTLRQIDSAVARWTGGRGFDAVVVTAPSADMQGLAPEFASRAGAVALFASLPRGGEAITLNSRTVHYREQLIYGVSDSTPAHVRSAVAWIGRNTDHLAALVTHRLPLRCFQDGLRAMMDRSALKVVLLPREAA